MVDGVPSRQFGVGRIGAKADERGTPLDIEHDTLILGPSFPFGAQRRGRRG